MKRTKILFLLLAHCWHSIGYGQSLYDCSNMTLGKIDTDGTVRDRSNMTVGRFKSDGWIVDCNNVTIGKIVNDGRIVDRSNLTIEKAEKDGYEGLGDCYFAKGNKQLAASYYRKCLNLDYYDCKNWVEKKLKELNM